MFRRGFPVFVAFYTMQVLSMFFDAKIAFGQDPNSSAESFSKSPMGTRAISMSESFVAVADDSSGMFYNPAGLNQLSWSYLSVHGQRIPLNRYATQIAILFPSIGLSGKLGLGVSTRFLLPKKKAPTQPFDGEPGKDTQYSFLQALSFAWNFNDSFSLGSNIKFIHQKMTHASSYAGGLDLGAFFRLSFLNLGFFIQDILTLEKLSKKPKETTLYYDPVLKLGIASDISDRNQWKISLQLDKNLKQDTPAIFRIGGYVKIWENATNTTQSSFPKALYFSFGYGDKKISAGFSLQIRRIKLDFAFRLPQIKWSKTELLATVDILLF